VRGGFFVDSRAAGTDKGTRKCKFEIDQLLQWNGVRLCTFVNFAADFALHNPEMADLVSLFWKQLDWIQTESYIAEEMCY